MAGVKKRPKAPERSVPVIVVGTGHHFQRNMAPALAMLEEAGHTRTLATIDIVSKESRRYFTGGTYLKRSKQPLSSQLAPFKKENPVIILGHANSLHAKDATDLLSHGYRIAVEKPYALTAESMRAFLSEAGTNQCALLEYYLTMKSAPLLLGYGTLDPKSFYFTESLVKPLPGLARFSDSVRGFSGMLPDLIGKVRRVEVEVLEGEGETGTLEARGIDTVDMRCGGGMIEDMAIHGIVPLVALEDALGRLPLGAHYAVRIAHCREYLKTAKRRFAIPEECIGETYAEYAATTDAGVDVSVRFGKYVFGNRNRRGIRLVGSKGSAYMDWNSCTLSVGEVPVLEMHKNYYPVLLSALACLSGEPLYTFDPLLVAARAQEIVFDLQHRAYQTNAQTHYAAGSYPEDIFSTKPQAADEPEEEELRPENAHDTWLGILQKELAKFFPARIRKAVACPGCGSTETDASFKKFGFAYHWCKNCASLYASPRPPERQINAFYKRSKAMRFYGEQVFAPSLPTRRREQIAPFVSWISAVRKKYAPKAGAVLDFMPKYFSVWADAALAAKSITLADPVYPVHLPRGARRVSVQEAEKRTYEIITAIDVLDHRADPSGTIALFSKLLKRGGLLYIGVNTGSGFEYQVLGEHAHRLVPPNRLNLLSVEAIKALLEEHGFEIVDEATPGKLDVDIVLKTLAGKGHAHTSRFITYLLNKRGSETWESLQEFLQKNELSSYLRLAAIKK